jgi:hypothetical protein
LNGKNWQRDSNGYPHAVLTFQLLVAFALLIKILVKFPTMPDLNVTLPTWPDIGRHREPKMSAMEPEVEITSGFVAKILSFGCRMMSGRVGSAISYSDMIDNVRVAVEIAMLSFYVQKLFPLLVSWPTF